MLFTSIKSQGEFEFCHHGHHRTAPPIAESPISFLSEEGSSQEKTMCKGIVQEKKIVVLPSVAFISFKHHTAASVSFHFQLFIIFPTITAALSSVRKALRV